VLFRVCGGTHMCSDYKFKYISGVKKTLEHFKNTLCFLALSIGMKTYCIQHWNIYVPILPMTNQKFGNETQFCISCLTVAAAKGCNASAPTATFPIAYLKMLLSTQTWDKTASCVPNIIGIPNQHIQISKNNIAKPKFANFPVSYFQIFNLSYLNYVML
jgi:hypothetical protein